MPRLAAAFFGIVAVILLVLLWRPAIPDRALNEQKASEVLSRLSAAEAYYRATDRDGNGIKDFWTGDVAGLYPEPEQILDRGIAEADASPLHPLVPRPVPYYGYYFIALRQDESASPPEDFAQDTDQKSGKVHHLSKFAFCAFPAEMGVTGKYVYIVNQGSTQYRMPLNPPPKNWPARQNLLSWSKFGG